MAVDGLNMKASIGVERFRETFAEFLAGRINLQLVLEAMQELLSADPDQSTRLQSEIDAALQAGQLPEPTWDRLTSEFDRLLASEEPTEWSLDATGPQFAGQEEPAAESTQAATANGAGNAAPLRPGTLLKDRYVVVSAVSGGAMGTVYKALDRRRKESGDPQPWVAIKLIDPAFAGSPEALAALENEVAICRRLNHPAIVTVHGLERDGKRPFIVMEWLDGDTLAELFRRQRGRLPAEQAVRILRDVCDALEHAHAAGIVHADVKPANVFVTHAGNAKLIDFGIARLLDGGGQRFDAAQLGARTPGWASCEVLEGQPVDTRDELYSLGLLAYRLFAGRRAFGDLGALEAEAAGIEPACPAGLAPHRWQALRATLAFRRAQRPDSIRAFRDAFFAPAPDQPAPAAEPPAETAEEIVLETITAPPRSLEALARDDPRDACGEAASSEDEDTAVNPELVQAHATPPAARGRRALQLAAAVALLALGSVLASLLLREPRLPVPGPDGGPVRPTAERRALPPTAETRSRPPAASERTSGKAALAPIELQVTRRALAGDSGGLPADAASGLPAADDATIAAAAVADSVTGEGTARRENAVAAAKATQRSPTRQVAAGT
ncbi:MAG: serine/threonine protein kinase, partial [Gammaproteobacteria bacterium]